MIALYGKNDANFPRLETDVFFVDFDNKYTNNGYLNEMAEYIKDFQLKNPTLWERFVYQFRHDADFDSGWRGEYWGKMMRGACFVYSLTRDEELYAILKKTVYDMMESSDESGRISSYDKSHEFSGWDMWSRKYVLLGMQYFIEICDDEEFIAKITESMKAQVDYLMLYLGEGKKAVCTTSRYWRGLNASSILEPIVRLYNITGEEKYLEFAKHIAEKGGMDSFNVVDLVLENNLYPYQYPMTKAYEMISYFEGLLEYYRATKEEKYKTAVIYFADKVLESDFTVIGCCGSSHELFDHSTVRQANTTNGLQQETCVTVTMMKFMYQLTLLTGDSKYVDAFERSLYNAYLGAVNTDKVIEPTLKDEFPDLNYEPLPFDSYSPLTAGLRGKGIGGFKVMSDKHYYGCCACIGSAGIGLYSKMALMTSKKGFALNLYNSGTIESKTPNGNRVIFDIETEYPVGSEVKITLSLEKDEKFELKLRNPQWSKTTSLLVNGESVSVNEGYITLDHAFKDGDEIVLCLDMRTEAIYPTPYGSQVLMNRGELHYLIPAYDKEDPLAKNHIALRRGPLFLAQENRLGYSVDDAVEVDVNADGYVDVGFPEKTLAPYKNMLEVTVPLKDGGKMHVTDYASAGKKWTEESKMAVWMLTK